MDETNNNSNQEQKGEKSSLGKILQNTGNNIAEKLKDFGYAISDFWDDHDMNAKCILGAFVLAGAIGLSFLGGSVSRRLEFKRIYHQKLFQYGDKNRDGLVSAVEQDEFDRKLLSGRGVFLIHDEIPKYEDGTNVPIKKITEWLRDYKPLD